MATLNDVAKLAGVAPVTVSRVINDPGAVREETRERVRKAMAQLQYIPNMAARNLVTKRSGVIDIYLPESMDLSNPFAMHFISGISEVLSQHMYSCLLYTSSIRGRESPYWDWFFIEGERSSFSKCNYRTFADVPYMPKLNTDNDEVIDYFCRVGRYWIEEFGADGWRLDVSDEISMRFLRRFREAVKSAKPDVYKRQERSRPASACRQPPRDFHGWRTACSRCPASWRTS